MSKGAWKNHAYSAKKFIDGKWRYFYGNATGAVNKVGKGIRDFHTTKTGMALKYNPVSNAINKASSAAKAKKGRILYANQKNAYMRNPNERNQQLARQGKSSNNVARLKASVLRETAQAKKGAAKILLDLKSNAKKAAKKFKYSANRPDYAVGRAFRKAGKGIKNAKTYAKAAAGNIRVAGQRMGIVKKAPDYSWSRKHQLGVDRVNKSNWIHYAGSSENTRGMNKTGEGIRAERNKIAAKGKAYYKSNNAAITANKKGKSQTEYYKNLQKKQAAKKAAKRQADLDRMTSTSKSDASIFSNTPRRPGYLDLGIDKKKTKKGSRSGFSWSYK